MARFSCATWRPISTNIGGSLSPNLGVFLHHQAGNGSLFSFFNNPAAKVSAHFWISKTGVIEQYVDTNQVAWHARQANTRYVGVETEGCPGGRDEPFTEAQIDAFARLFKEGMQKHGWPPQLANQEGQRGFGYHRMAVNTACPCNMRLEKRGEIIRRATQGVTTPPTPEPEQEQDMVLIITNPKNNGLGLLDVARGEWRGISSPDLLNWYKAQGIKQATGLTVAQFEKFKQVGTV